MMYFMVEGRRVRRRHAFTPVALTMASTVTNCASTVLWRRTLIGCSSGLSRSSGLGAFLPDEVECFVEDLDGGDLVDE
jgi:hypothetical protein